MFDSGSANIGIMNVARLHYDTALLVFRMAAETATNSKGLRVQQRLFLFRLHP